MMARAPSASDRHGVAVSLSALEEKADGAAARVTHSLRDAGYVIITLPSSVAQTIQQSIASLKSALQAHREAETKGWVTPNSSKREPIRFGISSYRTRTQFRMLRHAPAEGELEATASSATSILQRCAAAVLDAVEGSLHTFQGASNLASLHDDEGAMADVFFYPPFADCLPEPSTEIQGNGFRCSFACPAHQVRAFPCSQDRLHLCALKTKQFRQLGVGIPVG
mmetsp:Transcript_58260/g.126534  ORF Transcript_58260/g.126534 Transcript_58260/m.126534 type:complete len:224 (+) Transcript_58260:15-686(+)